jgi:NDP-sugar pyrophosphorylase family protein
MLPASPYASIPTRGHPNSKQNLIPFKTLTLPKPLVEFANKPMILHQIQALAAAGVTDIVLAVNYRPEIMTAALKKVRPIPPFLFKHPG